MDIYSRDALCCWGIIVLAIVSALTLVGSVFDASHGRDLIGGRGGGPVGFRDSWMSEEVQVVGPGSKLVFYLASFEPEGEKGSLTRCLLVLHDVGAGRARCVSEGRKLYSVTTERSFTSSRAERGTSVKGRSRMLLLQSVRQLEVVCIPSDAPNRLRASPAQEAVML